MNDNRFMTRAEAAAEWRSVIDGVVADLTDNEVDALDLKQRLMQAVAQNLMLGPLIVGRSPRLRTSDAG